MGVSSKVPGGYRFIAELVLTVSQITREDPFTPSPSFFERTGLLGVSHNSSMRNFP
jgi:hypothetical protein